MTDRCHCANPQTDRIRTLNDAFRTSLTGGSVMITRAVAALGTEAQREILTALRRYHEFDADNDPYGEHDFGMIAVQSHEILFKIDYYDQDLVRHSPDAADPAVTHRVLTVMLAEDC
jgi:Protein of unknown function (DUF3768)